MKRRYSCIAIILIMCILSACHNKKKSVSTSVNDTGVTTEASNDISDETRKLLELGEYDDIELKGDSRDVVSIVKMIKDFFFQSVRCFL